MPQDDLTDRLQGAGFLDSFGRLVGLLRRDRDNVPAQKAALRAAMARLGLVPVILEAGFECTAEADEVSLSARLHARRIDSLRVAPSATAKEVLEVARALASDDLPVLPTTGVVVDFVPTPPETPQTAAPAPGPSPAPSPGRGARLMYGVDLPPPPRRELTTSGVSQAASEAIDAMGRALKRGQLREALHSAQALVRLLPTLPEEGRRGTAIAARRHLTRPVVESLLGMALRTPEERSRCAEVLQFIGLDAAEAMLDALKESDAVGPRAFIRDALAEMAEAYPIVLPLLKSGQAHELRLGADLLGRMGKPEAIEPLKAHLDHPDERVRQAVIEALGRFTDRSVVDPLRQMLSHPSPGTRAAAGQAIGARRTAALAMPLLAAIEEEKDAKTWKDMIAALALIDTPEANTALVRMATQQKSLFSRGGFPLTQRLDVVAALAAAKTPGARLALQRIRSEGDRPVRDAAERVLGRPGRDEEAR